MSECEKPRSPAELANIRFWLEIGERRQCRGSAEHRRWEQMWDEELEKRKVSR